MIGLVTGGLKPAQNTKRLRGWLLGCQQATCCACTHVTHSRHACTRPPTRHSPPHSGAIYIYNVANNGPVAVAKIAFTGSANILNNRASMGGAIAVQDVTWTAVYTVPGCSMTGNRAEASGGAVYTTQSFGHISLNSGGNQITGNCKCFRAAAGCMRAWLCVIAAGLLTSRDVWPAHHTRAGWCEGRSLLRMCRTCISLAAAGGDGGAFCAAGNLRGFCHA